ncbi:hypothetical protein LY78DRAFT_225755 [Colletotrichum sublineola]|nr:hypothetical protein LY78DRAFT_225755 [Colletotrichum sublineola]
MKHGAGCNITSKLLGEGRRKRRTIRRRGRRRKRITVCSCLLQDILILGLAGFPHINSDIVSPGMSCFHFRGKHVVCLPRKPIRKPTCAQSTSSMSGYVTLPRGGRSWFTGSGPGLAGLMSGELGVVIGGLGGS